MKNVAKLYFQPSSTAMAKEVAQRVRLQNNLCHLIYSGLFNGPENCEPCDAVIIEKGANKWELIAKCYAAFNPNTEIHYIDEKGNFINADQPGKVAADARPADPAPAPAAPEAAADVQPAAVEEGEGLSAD